MKVAIEKRRQRHVRARRAYWESVYCQNGMRRVPMPCVEHYTEEGEIVPWPPLSPVETPLRNLLPRRSAPGFPAVGWKSIFAEDEVPV